MSEYPQRRLFYCVGTKERPHERVEWTARVKVMADATGSIEQHPDDGCFFCPHTGESMSKWYREM